MSDRTEELLRRILEIPDQPKIMQGLMAAAVKLDLTDHLKLVKAGKAEL